MNKDNATPKASERSTSSLNPLCDNSCPPRNPIANKRYKEINLEELAGNAKSLFSTTARIPRMKNRNVGFEKLFSKMSILINRN